MASVSGTSRFFSATAEVPEEHKWRHIDFTSVAWPEVNPIDYTAAGYRMQNYRFPATCNPADRKGIV